MPTFPHTNGFTNFLSPLFSHTIFIHIFLLKIQIDNVTASNSSPRYSPPDLFSRSDCSVAFPRSQVGIDMNRPTRGRNVRRVAWSYGLDIARYKNTALSLSHIICQLPLLLSPYFPCPAAITNAASLEMALITHTHE